METEHGRKMGVGLPTETQIGGVSLVTNNVGRLSEFYERTLGLRILARGDIDVHLGPSGGETFLTLTERAGAQRAARQVPGVYHLAVLLPTRGELARAFTHLLAAGVPFSGFADHQVSEALYLNDPDGNGIELYRDRPRGEWEWNAGLVAMAVDSLAAEDLLADAGPSPETWPGMPTATTLGHVHLRVADLASSERFYHSLLGFDVTTRLPGALFVAAGGYHHHLGLNTWHRRGASPPPDGTTGLRDVTIRLPHPADLAAVQDRLQVAEWPLETADDVLRLHDPSGNALSLTAASVIPAPA